MAFFQCYTSSAGSKFPLSGSPSSIRYLLSQSSKNVKVQFLMCVQLIQYSLHFKFLVVLILDGAREGVFCKFCLYIVSCFLYVAWSNQFPENFDVMFLGPCSIPLARPCGRYRQTELLGSWFCQGHIYAGYPNRNYKLLQRLAHAKPIPRSCTLCQWSSANTVGFRPCVKLHFWAALPFSAWSNQHCGVFQYFEASSRNCSFSPNIDDFDVAANSLVPSIPS